MRLGEVGDLLVESGGVPAQRLHGTARLDEAVTGHPLSLRQQADCALDITVVGEHRAHCLDLNSEGPEGVRENVVDLACNAIAFIEDGDVALLVS
jgi:hypothetical protein